MIKRFMEARLEKALQNNASVALLGPRQIGKTTLALHIRAIPLQNLLNKLSWPKIEADLIIFVSRYASRTDCWLPINFCPFTRCQRGLPSAFLKKY